MKELSKCPGRRQSRRSNHLLLIGILAAAFFLTIGVVVGLSRQKHAATASLPSTNTASAPAKEKRYIVRDVAGHKVAFDPQTGQARSLTPEEAKQMAEAIKKLVNQSTDGLTEVHHADGSVSMDLQGRFQDVVVARKESDGTVTQACVNNPETAAQFFEIDPALVRDGAKAPSNKTVKPRSTRPTDR